MFHEEGWRRLCRDAVRNNRREGQRAAIRMVQKDEGAGILTQAAARCSAWARGRRTVTGWCVFSVSSCTA
jgi:hypothetical protein